jgi:DNA-binding transcriptional LysR family regulator
VARKFLTIARGLYASPDYLAARGTPRNLDDLAAHRFLLLEGRTRPVPVIELVRGRKSQHVRMNGPIVVNSMGMMRALAAAGAGIAPLPRRMCIEDEALRRLTRVMPDWAPAAMDGYCIVPARKLLPTKARLFVEALVDYFKRWTDEVPQSAAASRPATTSPTRRVGAPVS